MELRLIPLHKIRAWHPVLERRTARLDLATSSSADLEVWQPECLDIALHVLQPWVLERGPLEDRHYLVIAGGQLLSACRRALQSDTLISALLIDSKFEEQRLLQIAAAHSAALAVAASCTDHEAIHAILKDASNVSAGILRDNTSSVMAALGAVPGPWTI